MWIKKNPYANSFSINTHNVCIAFREGVYNLPSKIATDVINKVNVNPLRDQFYSPKGVKIHPQGLIKFLGMEMKNNFRIASWEFVNPDEFNGQPELEDDLVSSSEENDDFIQSSTPTSESTVQFNKLKTILSSRSAGTNCRLYYSDDDDEDDFTSTTTSAPQAVKRKHTT